MLTGTGDGRPRKARSFWSPILLRVYGLRPWEMGGLTLGEYSALVDDLSENGA